MAVAVEMTVMGCWKEAVRTDDRGGKPRTGATALATDHTSQDFGKGPVAGKPTSKPLKRYVRIVDQGRCFGPTHCCAGI